LDKKRSARRKTIRYFRWAVKAAFLLIFTLPFAYFVTAPSLPVYSLFYRGLDQTPLVTLPYGQSVCSLFLVSFDTVGPGAWLICPVGGVQVLLTGKVTTLLLLPTIMALILFLIPIFVLGNVFCGWLCPLGTLIDGFDKGASSASVLGAFCSLTITYSSLSTNWGSAAIVSLLIGMSERDQATIIRISNV